MPAFNAVDSIRKAAESILNQTWKGIQLIIIDDQSDDGTWGVIQTLASEDSRVIALHNSINVGPYVSKNKALKLVEGKYITGQDADDWSHPQRIENQLRELRSQKNARAGISYMLRTTPEGNVTQFTSIGRLSYDGVARVSSISCIFETEFFKQRLGAWDSVRFGADSEIIERTRVILGDDLCDQQLITMICQDIEGSLTNDPKTGVRVEGHGLSPVRKAYKEAWSEWHKQLSLDNSLDSALGFSVAGRQFLAPEEMQVADKDLDVIYSN
jgi:glycosyltransferase involved in cell wall biosynthesis